MPPILIICPIDVQRSWIDKIGQQYPNTSIEVMGRKPADREEFVNSLQLGTTFWYIMHWAGVRIMADKFNEAGIVFGTIIADEVHNISNHKQRKVTDATTGKVSYVPVNQTRKALTTLRTYTKIGISGTPSGDKPEGLYGVLNWIDPKRWKSYWSFVGKYIETEVVDGYQKLVGPKNEKLLHWTISPYYVRHLKDRQCCEHHPNGVMPWLPPKVHKYVYVDLNTKQRRAYDQMFNILVAWVGEQEEDAIIAPVAIAQLIRLGQFCLATPVVEQITKQVKIEDDLYEKSYELVNLELPSSKYDALLHILESNPDVAPVVFTTSKKMAYLVSEALKGSGISNAVLSGDTDKGIRQTLVDQFVSGKFRVFIGVIAAMAEGVDGLQKRSSTAIFIDRHRSSIKNQQAEDRLHRGGQLNSTTIIDIVANDTIDEYWVFDRLPAKLKAISAILGDNN